MSLFESIDPDEADRLLAEPETDKPARQPRKRKDPTQPRTLENWFAQFHRISAPCENPECVDDRRPPSDRGRNTTAPVLVPDGELQVTQFICRLCFLSGYPNVTA